MIHPIFICNGVFRSGSTWSFNVCRKLAAEIGALRGQPVGSVFMDHSQLDQFIRVGTTRMPGPAVIKAHFIGPVTLQFLSLSRARAVCTYRDPRDCVASDRTFLGWDMKRIIERVRGNFQAIDAYRGCAGILMVRYEDMMADTLQQIRRIAAHLGVDASEATLRKIDGETNRQSSLKVCQQLKNRSPNEVLHVADHRVDLATQLHDNHIYNSKVGRWRTELSPEEGRELTRIFYPWLVKFGYDTSVPRPGYSVESHVDLGSGQAAVPLELTGTATRPSAN